MDRIPKGKERRGWPRLPLPMPLFVRSRDSYGKDLLEFATALNISGGGALLAIHGPLRPAVQVSLEIPSAPLPPSLRMRKSSRNFRARVVRVTHADGYNLVAMRFLQPLLKPTAKVLTPRRKVASLV